MKKKQYILLAVVSYLIIVIATIPAKSITDLISNNSPINMQGISGTLWNGRAYAITINRGTTLKDTRWSFTLWKLLIGQLAADVHSRYLGNDIDTEIGSSFFGGYFVNDLITEISAKEVTRLASIPLAQLSGPIAINIEHARWSQGELPQANGEIKWNNAVVTVADTISLGNVTILLTESEQQLLNVEIKNQGGDISITGTAKLVPESDYAIDIKLSPTASTKGNIEQSLGLFAKKQPNGEYLFKNTGSLSQIGLM